MVEPPYQKHKLNKVFGGVEMDLAKLKKFMEGTQEPLLGYLKHENVPEPQLDFVEHTPPHAHTFFDVKGKAVDKSYAVVVAGESGSGKSVYSCLQAKEKGFLTVYTSIRPPKDQESPGSLEKAMAERPEPGLEKLDAFLQLLIIFYGHYVDNDIENESLCNLYDIKDMLNFSRNEWAKKVLHAALTDTVGKYTTWLAGRWEMGSRPKKVAIVVDEATDLFLAEGLVSTVRKTSEYYRQRLTQERLLIIVTGTGLDQIKYANCVGTNPAYSRLTVMKTPMVNMLHERGIVSPAVRKALNEGAFSKILKTNSRILFRSLLPILKLKYHEEDGYIEEAHRQKRQCRYEERLVEVASTRCIMDHGPRFYVNQNSLGDLSGNVRDQLLCQAFLFHLEMALYKSIDEEDEEWNNTSEEIKKVVDSELEECRCLQSFMDIKGDDQYDIFNRGLATIAGTSNALKFLACFGLTCEVRPAFGDRFEELTELHFLRCMQVQGYETQRIALQHAWPPKSTKGWTMENLMSTLKEQEKDEGFSLTGAEKEDAKICFVFSQGTPTAQGGDVLALLVHANGDAELVAILCKHYKRSPRPSEVKKWWNLLGINFDEADWEPQDHSSAGYSFKGLDSFRGLLKKKLENLGSSREVVLGDRIMATSFSAPGGTTEFPIPPASKSGRKARVWFQEMLEPTISSMVLRG